MPRFCLPSPLVVAGRLILAAVAGLAIFPAVGSAEKPLMTAAEMRELASDVVVGKVKAIYTRAEQEGDWKVTHSVAEVRVDAVEKGQSTEPGKLIYVRFWQRQWNSDAPQPPDTNGHDGVGKVGDAARFYLVTKGYDGAGQNTDGGYNLVFRNGCVPLQSPDRDK
jgi:hypothetical protein